MIEEKLSSFWVKIYLSGSIEIIKNTCREYCLKVGLCVTMKEVLFVYTGGEECGAEIGLINYPRFPDTENSIMAKAIDLANRCRNASFQHSYLILTPLETIWNSTRIENKKGCDCNHSESCPNCLP